MSIRDKDGRLAITPSEMVETIRELRGHLFDMGLYVNQNHAETFDTSRLSQSVRELLKKTAKYEDTP